MNRVDVAQAYLAAYRLKMGLLRYYIVRRLATLGLRSRSETRRIYVWPPFDEHLDAEELASFHLELRYYLGNLDISVQYHVRTSGRLRCCVLESPSDESAQEKLSDELSVRRDLQRARYCVIWRVKGKPRAASMRPHKYFIASTLDCHGVNDWLRLVSDIYRSQTSLPRRTVPFPQYPVDSCAVLGSGPSIDYFDSESDQYNAWVGANEVAGDERIRHLGNPFALCALDPQMFVPLDSARFLRLGIFALLRETPAVFITTLDYAAFIELNFPTDVKKKCHYVKTLGHGTNQIGTTFDLQKMVVTLYGNVLADLMLPVATSISRSITLYGCDGKPPGSGSSNFPKSMRFQGHIDSLAKEKSAFGETFYRTYFERNSLYTRYIIDECIRQGSNIQLRVPSWNKGLQHLPVVGYIPS